MIHTPRILVLALLAATPLGAGPAPFAAPTAQASFPSSTRRAPEQLYDVTKVVDGDTIYVQREGSTEKLRLLSVDTEERIQTSYQGSATKPNTVFGEECALWAEQFFADLAEGDQPTRVGLLFPDGVEQRDVYGRLLCHVLLADGTDFNLLLVQKGKSPYFNKYGNSKICHAEFVAAQRKAREQQLGIWNPATNQPATPGAKAAKRPYEQLMPWWDARAAAIDSFRVLHGTDPEAVVDADVPAELERAASAGGARRVFGTVYRTFDEDDGSLTVLFRASDRDRAFRARIAEEHRPLFQHLDLAHRGDNFRQNFLWVRGELQAGERGYEIRVTEAEQIELAGPEPSVPGRTGPQ